MEQSVAGIFHSEKEDELGIIVPPPSVRSILEKTAAAVGKKPALERLILVKHAADPKFSFLRESDPFHAYYRAQVEEARCAKSVEIAQSDDVVSVHDKTKTPEISVAPAKILPSQEVAPSLSKLNAERLKAEKHRPVPDKPPPDDLFILPDISPMPSNLALDVMKLTAEYDARFGREFTMTLASREYRNHLFDFLQPTHPHFFVFERLAEAYSVILRPSQGREQLVALLRKRAETSSSLFESAWYRFDWRQTKLSQDPKLASNFPEGAAHAVVDWHDFVVLETVDIEDSEQNLPAPLPDPEQIPRVMAAADAARREWENNRVEVDMDLDMEIESDDVHNNDISLNGRTEDVVTADVDADIPTSRVRHSSSSFERNQPRPADSDSTATIEANRQIEKSIVSDASAESADGHRTNISARLPDGEIVPISESNPAIVAKLVNPKYKEERTRAEEKNMRFNLADGEQMARNLARLNRDKLDSGVYNKGDLQGSLAQRAMHQTSAREPIVLPKAIMSGPQLPNTHGKVSRDQDDDPNSQPMKRAKVEAAVGALTNATKAQASISSGNAEKISVDQTTPGQTDVLPGLLSEIDWLQRVGEKVEICVRIPVHANKEWQLAGQEINMEVPLRSTVAKLKDVLAKCVRLPANKQKLQFGKSGFMKDRLSLASYNISSGGVINLEVKERGGRGKK